MTVLRVSNLNRLLLAVMIVVAASRPLAAQDSTTQSGYEQSSSLETGDSVTEDLALDDARVGGVLSFPKVEQFFSPWFDAKRRWNEQYGLKLQFSLQTLHQGLSDSVTGIDEAAAYRAQVQGSWTLIGRSTSNPGTLTFRFENRQKLGTEIAPTSLNYQYGGITPSGAFSDFGHNLSELAWRQTLLDGKFKFVVGKISAISWYNGHALSSGVRGFQNLALQSSLSKPSPGRGIGGGIAFQPSPYFGFVAGIHDANAKTAENPFDSIGEGEFFKSVEFRYFPTGDPARNRYDVVRLQFWHQDELKEKGTPASHGLTFLASRLFDDKWFPFIMGGWSDGDASIMKQDLTAGLGIGFDTKHRAARDVLGMGVSWGDPSNESLQDQYTSEMFYRFTLVENFALTPSVQMVVNPAANPKLERAFTAGIRARITF